MSEQISTIQQLRKELKELGYKVKTKTLSWGVHATYVDDHTGEEFTGTVHTAASLTTWLTLIEWLQANEDRLMIFTKLSEIRGLLIHR